MEPAKSRLHRGRLGATFQTCPFSTSHEVGHSAESLTSCALESNKLAPDWFENHFILTSEKGGEQLKARNLILTTAVVSGLAGSAFPQNPWGRDLLAYWSFDEGKGDVVGDYVGQHPGKRNGSTAWVAGKDNNFGSAMRFDKSDPNNEGYVSLPQGGSLQNPNTSAITISVWVRSDVAIPSMTEPYASIFQSDPAGVFSSEPGAQSSMPDNYIMYYDGKSDNLRVKFTNSANKIARPAVPATEVPVGKWYHIAGVYDGSNASIYLNGMKKDQVPFTGELRNGQVCAIGRKGMVDKEYWMGDMDDLAIWKRALTPAEISALASGRSPLSQLLRGASDQEPVAFEPSLKPTLHFFFLPDHQRSVDFYNSVIRNSANQETIGRYNVVPVNMQTNNDEAAEHGAVRSPTIIIRKADGSVAWKSAGVPEASEFLNQLKRLN